MLDVKTCVAISCILGSAGPVLAATVSPIASEAALKTAVSQHVSQLMQQQQIPGMAVAVLQGKTFHYSFGQADVAAQRAVTPDTVFELGSISKTYAGCDWCYGAGTW